jgi:hypothetical protein
MRLSEEEYGDGEDLSWKVRPGIFQKGVEVIEGFDADIPEEDYSDGEVLSWKV